MFFSSVNGSISGDGFRPSAINITVGNITTTIIDELNSSDGEEWDTVMLSVDIPANITSLKMQALSIDLPGEKPVGRLLLHGMLLLYRCRSPEPG